MSTGKEELEVEDDFISDEQVESLPPPEVAKTDLTKRRIIDNLLEERNLQRKLKEFYELDFDNDNET